jgi:hypothetical protein
LAKSFGAFAPPITEREFGGLSGGILGITNKKDKIAENRRKKVSSLELFQRSIPCLGNLFAFRTARASGGRPNIESALALTRNISSRSRVR